MTTKTKKATSRGSLTGSRSTIAEAKRNLETQIDDALSGDYQPRIVNYRIWTAIVYRDPTGWHYRLVGGITEPGIKRVEFGNWYKSRDAAIQAAVFHVLDLGSSRDEFHCDADIPDWLMDQSLRDTLLSNARFQRAYAYAKANQLYGGNNDHSWHQWACNNSRDPRFA